MKVHRKLKANIKFQLGINLYIILDDLPIQVLWIEYKKKRSPVVTKSETKTKESVSWNGNWRILTLWKQRNVHLACLWKGS